MSTNTNEEYRPWINKDIIIDFPVPNDILEEFKHLEELDKPETEFEYYTYAESMDLMCKEAVRRGEITNKQWEIIERRFFNE